MLLRAQGKQLKRCCWKCFRICREILDLASRKSRKIFLRRRRQAEGSVTTPTDRAKLTAKFSIERLRSQVSELSSRQYPGDHPGPQQWLGLVAGLIDTGDLYLSASERAGTTDAEALKLATDAAQLATEAYNYLVLMTGADIDQLAYPIVAPLQRWFSQLHIPNSTFFRAEQVVNYELRPIAETYFTRIRDPAPTLSAAIAKVRFPMLRVTVPSKAFAIIPHLAIVGHEIGHALIQNVNWNLTSFAPEEGALKQRISQRLGRATLDRGTLDILQEVFSKWFQELASDAFGLFLTGPAMFFSGSELAQFGRGYGLSPSHPASDLRRSILFSRLSEGGANSFAQIFEKHTGQRLTEEFNSPMLRRTPSKDQIANDAIARRITTNTAAVMAELHELIPRIVDIVYDQIRNYLTGSAPDAIYTPAQYDRDLSEHLAPMLVAVPPIETGAALDARTPTDFASILNVGWCVLLTKLSDLRIKTSGSDQFHSERLERLHSLLLKAVELSEARRSWANP